MMDVKHVKKIGQKHAVFKNPKKYVKYVLYFGECFLWCLILSEYARISCDKRIYKIHKYVVLRTNHSPVIASQARRTHGRASWRWRLPNHITQKFKYAGHPWGIRIRMPYVYKVRYVLNNLAYGPSGSLLKARLRLALGPFGPEGSDPRPRARGLGSLPRKLASFLIFNASFYF